MRGGYQPGRATEFSPHPAGAGLAGMVDATPLGLTHG